MPVNPYDYRKVSLWRPLRNGDLDIVRASYTRSKANVTEALNLQICLLKLLAKIKFLRIFPNLHYFP